MKMNLLKTLFVSTTLVGASFFAACDEQAGIQIGIPQTQETVYMIVPLSSVSLTKIDTISSNLDSMLTANEATREDIDYIELTGLSLALTDKNGVVNTTQNFNNIKSIGINISELTGNYTSLASVDSATMALSFRNMNPIVLPNQTVPVNLLPFVSSPSFRVQLDGKLFNPTTDTMYIKSIMTIKIGVTI